MTKLALYRSNVFEALKSPPDQALRLQIRVSVPLKKTLRTRVKTLYL